MSTAPRPEPGREIATTQDGIDITRGYIGPLLLPLDSVQRTRGNYDLQIYEQVLSDEEVKSALNQRMLAVTQCEWDVEPGGKRAIDKAAAADLKLQLHGIGWDNVTTKMLFGVFYGYAVSEIIYRPDGARVVMDKIKVRNRRRFRFGKDGDLRMLTMNNMTEGVPAEAPYFWAFSCGADHDDEPYGLGLAHWLYWPVLFKRNGVKFWLIYAEKFGMPTAVGHYEADANEGDRLKLLAATKAIQTDSGIILPKGMELALLEAARSGTADYAGLYNTMNAAIQKAVLGQTASTQGTPGKLGADDLQADVRADIVKADADLVCESFNLGPARWLTEWNFPGAAVPRVYRVTEKPEDLDTRADRDKKVGEMGFVPSLAYITATYGGEWQPKAEPPPAVPQPGGASFAAPPADGIPTGGEWRPSPLYRARGPATQFADAPGNDPLPSAPLAAQLAPLAQPIIDGWIDTLSDMARTATSYAELRALVVDSYADLPADQLGTLLDAALQAANAAGRYDIAQAGNG